MTDYPNLYVERAGAGVLMLTMHSDGGAPQFGGEFYDQLADFWRGVEDDPTTAVVLWTNAGGEWLARMAPHGDGPSPYDLGTRGGADRLYRAQRRLLAVLFAVETPIVAAVPGPASLHPEFLLAADIIIATPEATFMPGWGLGIGMPAADGAALWLDALGPVQGRAVLMSGATLSAQEGQRRGIYYQIVSPAELMAVASGHATRLAALPELSRRHTRRALTRRMQHALIDEIPLGDALIALAARREGPAS